MISFLLSLFFCCSIEALAKIDQIDSNKDGKTDLRYEYNNEGNLTSLSIDSDFDGSWDEIREAVDGQWQITKLKIGKNKFREIVKAGKANNLYVSRYLWRNSQWVELPSYIISKGEKKNETDNAIDCFRDPIVGKELTELFKFETLLKKQLPGFSPDPKNKDYFISNSNILVHKSCIKRYGNERLDKLLKDAILEGSNCMLKNAHSPIAQQNVDKISSILQNKTYPLKIECEAKACWDDMVAFADAIYTTHPTISLSPFTEEFKKDDAFFKATFFHELLHNCGHDHHSTIDYAHACDGCCHEKKELSVKAHESACKICGGKYSHPDNIAYLNDLYNWSNGHPHEYSKSANLVHVENQYLQMGGEPKRELNKLIFLALAQSKETADIASTLLDQPGFDLDSEFRNIQKENSKLPRPLSPRSEKYNVVLAYIEYLNWNVGDMYPHLQKIKDKSLLKNEFVLSVASKFIDDREVKADQPSRDPEEASEYKFMAENIKKIFDLKLKECKYPWPPLKNNAAK